jgi:iron complex transport system ATP-binding protein
MGMNPNAGLVIRSLTKTANMSFDIDSLELRRGEITAILGPNGAGKSTLLRALAQLESSDAEVSFDGKALGPLTTRERAQLIAYVPQQQSATAGFSVREVVEMARYPWPASSDSERAVQIAIEEFGIEPLLSRRVVELSGGELARVFFARARAQATEAVLLDEPLASLDLAHQEQLVLRLRQYAESGMAVVLVIHDLNQAASFVDRAILMRQGSVVASGRPAAVFTEANIEAAYQQPVRVQQHPEYKSVFVSPIRKTRV